MGHFVSSYMSCTTKFLPTLIASIFINSLTYLYLWYGPIGFLIDHFYALLGVAEAFFVNLGLPLDYLLEALDPFELAL